MALKSKWDFDTFRFCGPGSWDPGMLESCLASLSSPLQFPQRAVHTKNKTSRKIRVQKKASCSVRSAGWLEMSFKEQNHEKCISKPTWSVYIFFRTHKYAFNKNFFWLHFPKLLILSSFKKYGFKTYFLHKHTHSMLSMVFNFDFFKLEQEFEDFCKAV